MNPLLILARLQAYFVYSGIAYKFKNGGLFAEINIGEELKKYEAEYETNQGFQELIHCIQSWDGQFATLYTAERALADLTKKIVQKDFSQSVLIKQWKIYGKLKPEKDIDEIVRTIDRGFCAGLSYASTVELLPFIKDLPSDHIAHQIEHFENILQKISQWDGISLSNEIEDCFAILKTFAITLQKEQFNGLNAISHQVPAGSLPQPILNFSFVHNQETLKQQMEQFLQPGNLCIFAASNHAARVYVTEDNKIIYYNPNEQFAYLCFELSNIDYFLSKLPEGFASCYPERFALTSIVYNFTGGCKNLPALPEILSALIQLKLSPQNSIQKIIDTTDSLGRSALHLSCYEDDTAQVSKLLEMGANPNLVDTSRNQALHYAVMRNNIDNVKALLALDTIEVNNTNATGYAPLHISIAKNPLIANFFIQDKRTRLNLKTSNKSKKPGATALHLAVFNEQTEIAQALISHPDVRLNERMPDGITALHIAAGLGNKELVNAFLKEKERLELDTLSQETSEQFPLGMTALCYAMEVDAYEVAILLLKAGASLEFLPPEWQKELTEELAKTETDSLKVSSLSLFAPARDIHTHQPESNEKPYRFCNII